MDKEGATLESAHKSQACVPTLLFCLSLCPRVTVIYLKALYYYYGTHILSPETGIITLLPGTEKLPKNLKQLF